MLCQRIRKRYYKTLVTIVINSPLSPPSLVETVYEHYYPCKNSKGSEEGYFGAVNSKGIMRKMCNPKKSHCQSYNIEGISKIDLGRNTAPELYKIHLQKKTQFRLCCVDVLMETIADI